MKRIFTYIISSSFYLMALPQLASADGYEDTNLQYETQAELSDQHSASVTEPSAFRISLANPVAT